ncbi:hypothetical protein GCM10018793_39060 [Streptomyces sulfonofaciens]|uniref:Uncharacterized protein n=1 Tax=Streptomyces sulfonofaciens TaxID=68272 RepID=A0A919GBK5_9ACTN|nr:hypothetical protein GCM10018793_39060 [Streptomyces sulfonofaciens]
MWRRGGAVRRGGTGAAGRVLGVNASRRPGGQDRRAVPVSVWAPAAALEPGVCAGREGAAYALPHNALKPTLRVVGSPIST